MDPVQNGYFIKLVDPLQNSFGCRFIPLPLYPRLASIHRTASYLPTTLMVDLNNVDFHKIARRGDTEVMSVFLKAELDPDLRDHRGYTLLMIAAYNCKPEMVELLLYAGASIDAPDPAGNTPLMGLCFKGLASLAEHLLTCGADPNARNNSGTTPLLMAAMFKQPLIARHLLAHGGEIDATDPDVRTAADYARGYGHSDLMDMLEEVEEV